MDSYFCHSIKRWSKVDQQNVCHVFDANHIDWISNTYAFFKSLNHV